MTQNSSLKKINRTKKQLIDSIADENQISLNDVREVIHAFLDKVTESLANGDRLEFRNFGIFESVKRKQKIGRNPKIANIPIIIPARRIVKFTTGKRLEELISLNSKKHWKVQLK